MRLVLKYGGTSVGSLEKIKKIAEYIKELKDKVNEIVVVVSAMGKTTDILLEKARVLCGEPSKRELDMLMTVGEQESIALMSIALNGIGCPAVSYLGSQIKIETEGPYGDSQIKEINIEKIENDLAQNKVVIVAGFQGVNSEGDITTLGRGGSDTTAVALAGKLKCQCKIYTDVDGVYTEDPRKSKNAQKYKEISYNQMEKLSREGAQVMELRAVQIGHKYKVPIFIGKSLGSEEGTYISE